jgi:hypothetical protein
MNEIQSHPQATRTRLVNSPGPVPRYTPVIERNRRRKEGDSNSIAIVPRIRAVEDAPEDEARQIPAGAFTYDGLFVSKCPDEPRDIRQLGRRVL